MNDHVRGIWQAWLDGRKVQYRHDDGFWRDAKPMDAAFLDDDIEWPQDEPQRWRIKPDSETRYFRVYLSSEVENYTIRTVQSYSIPECESQQAIAMTHRGFVRWLNDWTNFEIEEN
jgi:hypothetical protein